MKFRLEIDMDNAAFGDDRSERAAEVARILAELATVMDANGLQRGDTGAVHDYNGNRVGGWRVTP